MRRINNELLTQFAAKGLTINEGVAVDARLVKSASHPKSWKRKNKIEKLQRAIWTKTEISRNSPAISNWTGR